MERWKLLVKGLNVRERIRKKYNFMVSTMISYLYFCVFDEFCCHIADVRVAKIKFYNIFRKKFDFGPSTKLSLLFVGKNLNPG